MIFVVPILTLLNPTVGYATVGPITLSSNLIQNFYSNFFKISWGFNILQSMPVVSYGKYSPEQEAFTKGIAFVIV